MSQTASRNSRLQDYHRKSLILIESLAEQRDDAALRFDDRQLSRILDIYACLMRAVLLAETAMASTIEGDDLISVCDDVRLHYEQGRDLLIAGELSVRLTA